MADEAMAWGIFSLVWLVLVTRVAYKKGVERGIRIGRAERQVLPGSGRGGADR